MIRPAMVVVLAVLAGCATEGPKNASNEPTAADLQNRARIHTELGALYADAGQLKTAVDEFKEALAADPRYAPDASGGRATSAEDASSAPMPPMPPMPSPAPAESAPGQDGAPRWRLRL